MLHLCQNGYKTLSYLVRFDLIYGRPPRAKLALIMTKKNFKKFLALRFFTISDFVNANFAVMVVCSNSDEF